MIDYLEELERSLFRVEHREDKFYDILNDLNTIEDSWEFLISLI